jgi:8-amino-7-oxononanoate synthase
MDEDIDAVVAGKGSAAGVRAPFDGYDLSHFYHGTSDDILDMVRRFDQWHRRAVPEGYHLYSQALQQGAEPMVRVRTRKAGKVRDLINLSSYNYLGIAQRPEVRSAATEALERYGLGASGSPLLSGTMDVHEELAHELSKFKRKRSTILFPTGYSAGLGFISALMRPGDTVLCDQYCHASAVDGAILSKSRTVFFRHNDPSDLDRRLRMARGRKLVVVEGVYSMDGDLCPLPQIVEVAARHGARTLIDEAHSTFVFGEDGRGVAEHFGVEDEIDFHLGTLSKALGGQGGYVCSTEEIADYVTAYGRARLFSCNLAPPVAAGVLAGLRIATAEPHLREQLWRNVRYLRRRLTEEAVDIGRTASHIIPVMVNDDVRIFPLTEKLQERGLFLPPVIYPAVSKNRSRLRIAASAAHTQEQLEIAVQVIAATLREEGIIQE